MTTWVNVHGFFLATKGIEKSQSIIPLADGIIPLKGKSQWNRDLLGRFAKPSMLWM